MFSKKMAKDEVGVPTQLKGSKQRALKDNVLETYPLIAPVIEAILPKKKEMTVSKCPNCVELYCIDGVPLFFNEKDGHIFPTLRLLQQYPFIMTRMQVDRGAIKFVLGGASIMCPGLTSKGAMMPDGIEADSPVAVFAEGKENPIAIGTTIMSVAQM
jgi:predicted RNA-binding protein (TIGR00451 family)